MYLRFKLKELQDKHSGLYGSGYHEFPFCEALADRVAALLRKHGHQAKSYYCSTSGLCYMVAAPTVSPETVLCVDVSNLGAWWKLPTYHGYIGVEVEVYPTKADIYYNPRNEEIFE